MSAKKVILAVVLAAGFIAGPAAARETIGVAVQVPGASIFYGNNMPYAVPYAVPAPVIVQQPRYVPMPMPRPVFVGYPYWHSHHPHWGRDRYVSYDRHFSGPHREGHR